MNAQLIRELDGAMRTGLCAVAALAMVAMTGGRADAAVPAGGVLHYDFDKAPANGVVVDRSGKKNNGRLAGATWAKSGKKGGGLQCKVGQGGLRVAGSPTLALKKATVSVWFKVKGTVSHKRVVLRNGGLGMVIDGAEKTRGKLAVELAGGPRCLGNTVVTNGAWHHAAATYDGTQLRLYVDGKLQKQISCKVPIAAVPAGVLLGMNPPGKDGKAGPALNGVLDEVMVFNRALSESEVIAIGSAIDPKIVVPPRKFSQKQIIGEIRRLNLLYEEGLLNDKYYTRKVRELEAAVEE